jgi:hypothetical protein
MGVIKKLRAKKVSKSSGCCGIEIKEVENTQEESCCATTEGSTSCCGATNEK